MSEPNTTKMEEMINQTENLIDTLETLNKEIESYQLAKNNLIDVKNQLQQTMSQFTETSTVIKDNIVQISQLFKSELTVRLEDLKTMAEQNKLYFDNKIKLITIIGILNSMGLIAVIVLLLTR